MYQLSSIVRREKGGVVVCTSGKAVSDLKLYAASRKPAKPPNSDLPLLTPPFYLLTKLNGFLRRFALTGQEKSVK
jgi:hypothetical protein